VYAVFVCLPVLFSWVFLMCLCSPFFVAKVSRQFVHWVLALCIKPKDLQCLKKSSLLKGFVNMSAICSSDSIFVTFIIPSFA